MPGHTFARAVQSKRESEGSRKPATPFVKPIRCAHFSGGERIKEKKKDEIVPEMQRGALQWLLWLLFRLQSQKPASVIKTGVPEAVREVRRKNESSKCQVSVCQGCVDRRNGSAGGARNSAQDARDTNAHSSRTRFAFD